MALKFVDCEFTLLYNLKPLSLEIILNMEKMFDKERAGWH